MKTEPEIAVSAQEIADRYSVHRRTVHRWVDNGCPALRPTSTMIRLYPSQVEEWIQSRAAEVERR